MALVLAFFMYCFKKPKTGIIDIVNVLLAMLAQASTSSLQHFASLLKAEVLNFIASQHCGKLA